MDKEDVVHTYNGILLSHKKEQSNAFAATWMQLEIIILSEVSQKKKDTYHVISFICGTQNMTQMNLFTKQKQTHGHRENPCGCQWGGGWGRWSGRLALVDVSYYIWNG